MGFGTGTVATAGLEGFVKVFCAEATVAVVTIAAVVLTGLGFETGFTGSTAVETEVIGRAVGLEAVTEVAVLGFETIDGAADVWDGLVTELGAEVDGVLLSTAEADEGRDEAEAEGVCLTVPALVVTAPEVP